MSVGSNSQHLRKHDEPRAPHACAGRAARVWALCALVTLLAPIVAPGHARAAAIRAEGWPDAAPGAALGQVRSPGPGLAPPGAEIDIVEAITGVDELGARSTADAGQDGFAPEESLRDVVWLTGPALGGGQAAFGQGESAADASLVDMLSALVTVRQRTPPGRRSPRGSSPRARATRSIDADLPLQSLLRPLVVDLIHDTLANAVVVDGKIVFSVLDQGAFVLELDGGRLALSELNTGATFLLRAGTTAASPAGPPRSLNRTPGEPVGGVPAAQRGDDTGARNMVDYLAHPVRALMWLAENPLILLTDLLGHVRRKALPEPEPEVAVTRAPAEAPHETQSTQQPERAPRRSRRRTSRRRTSRRGWRWRWRNLIDQLRESLGFPPPAQVRETDFAREPSRSRRRYR